MVDALPYMVDIFGVHGRCYFRKIINVDIHMKGVGIYGCQIYQVYKYSFGSYDFVEKNFTTLDGKIRSV